MTHNPDTLAPDDEIPPNPLTKIPSHGAGQDARGLLMPPNTQSPNMGSSKLREPSFDNFSRLSLSPGTSPLLEPIPSGPVVTMGRNWESQQQPSRLQKFWIRNRPALLVAMSQFFGSLMNLCARLVEFEGEGMHPVQVLLLRQSVTSVFCMLYMAAMKTPEFPFGRKDIRHLLITRGISGFMGIFGMWFSMMYLPLADATVITFLAPGVAGFFCYFLLKEPFTRLEQLSTFVALFGVILIAKPATLFSASSVEEPSTSEPSERSIPDVSQEATAEQRLFAVGVALLGVLGAAGAFTTLRSIGKRAHPLISVNYFGVISTIISATALIFAPILDIGQPGLRWITPTSVKQWLLLLPLGLMGFIMQYLLTAGLGSDKSNRANAMIYTHMLFAVTFDKWVFGHQMDLLSGAGCTLILGSAIGVVLLKKTPPPKPSSNDVERQGNLSEEEESSHMLLNATEASEDLRITR